MITVWRALVEGASLNLLVLVAAVFLISRCLPLLRGRPPIVKSLAFGIGLGICAVISLSFAFPIAPGILGDVRNAIVAIATVVSGPIAGTIVAAIAAAYRTSLGGMYITADIGIAGALLISIGFMLLPIRKSPAALAGLGVGLALWNSALPILGTFSSALATPKALSVAVTVLSVAVVLYPLVIVSIASLLNLELKRLGWSEALERHNLRLSSIEQRFQSVFDLACVSMAWYDPVRREVVRVNDAYCAFIGFSKDELVGKNFASLCHPDDRDELRAFHAALRISRIPSVSHEFRMIRKDGEVVWVARTLIAVPIDDHGAQMTFHIMQDITARKNTEQRLAFLATHDTLTGLANRAVMRETLAARAALATPESGAALFYLDLDDFKEVNDTLGHPLGDALLVAVAKRLGECVSEDDQVSRLGGDEFALVTSLRPSCPDYAAELAERIAESFRVPFLVKGHSLKLRVSIGVALAPEHGRTELELEKNADIALYAAKSDAATSYRFFDEALAARTQFRAVLRRELANALDRGELDLEYQPIIDLKTGSIRVFEALLRWRHPTRGTIPPGEFIPLAEETGGINAIGNWVLQSACREAAKWPADISVAINVSPAQFRSNALPLAVASALAASGLPPSRLEIEITESVLLNYSETNLAALRQLKDLGVSIALDDFGTGYSSLGYLQRFSFNKLKIDRSFVSAVVDNEQSRAVVRGIIALGHSLGIRITGEGVETAEQFERMRIKGCDELQGFYFSRAVPPNRIPDLLAARSAAA